MFDELYAILDSNISFHKHKTNKTSGGASAVQCTIIPLSESECVGVNDYGSIT